MCTRVCTVLASKRTQSRAVEHAQDEEAELLAELERIKKERAAEAARKTAEEAAGAEASARDELVRGNPLILGGAAAFQARARGCTLRGDSLIKNGAVLLKRARALHRTTKVLHRCV